MGARLAAPADPDSLAPDVVLIPQPALRHWLQQALAERYGVAANLDICTPSEFVWRLLREFEKRGLLLTVFGVGMAALIAFLANEPEEDPAN